MPVTTNTRKLAALLGASGSGIGTDGLLQSAGIDTDMATQAELDAAAYSDLKLRQDLDMLALHSAVQANRAAFNLPGTFIDNFEDDTGITTKTNVLREPGGEYCFTGSTASVDYGSGGFTPTYTPINAFTSGTMTHSKATDNNPLTGAGTGTSTNKAGLKVTFSGNGHALKLDSGELAIGSFRTAGDPKQYRVTHSMDDVTYTPFDFAWNGDNLVSYTTQTSSGSNSEFTNFSTGTGLYWKNLRSRGYLDLLGHASNSQGSIQRLTGMQTVYAKYAKVVITAATWYDANAYLSQFDFMTMTVVNAVSATGTLISDTQTTSPAVTKMSGVFNYKDHQGTGTIGTDLKIYFSANGGTNWTEAASYTAVPTVVFSTGVKMIRLGETTVTSGTTPVMKAVWANQSLGSKETLLYGWAMNY